MVTKADAKRISRAFVTGKLKPLGITSVMVGNAEPSKIPDLNLRIPRELWERIENMPKVPKELRGFLAEQMKKGVIPPGELDKIAALFDKLRRKT